MGLLDRFRRSDDDEVATSTGRALTAAATRVNLGDRPEAQQTATRSPAWQGDAWVYRDAVGEIRYAIDWLAAITSRLRLLCAVVLDPSQPPVSLHEATTPPVDGQGQPTGEPALVTDLPPDLIRDAVEALELLAGGGVGHGHLLDPLIVNLEVPGECYLLGIENPDTGTEEWSIRSMDELRKRADGRWVLVDGPSAGTTTGGKILDPETSYVARLWNPHPRYHSQADSPMRGILSSCEALLIAERKQRVRDRARLSRGVLLVAQELDFEAAPGQQVTSFQAHLQQAMISAVADESAASSLVPTMARIPADQIDNAMRKIDLVDKEDEERDHAKIERHLRRIARGLDVPPEVIEGLKDVKFANAIAIDSTGFRYHVEPKAIRCVDALTQGYLWERLEALGHDPADFRRIVVWYDPTEVVTNPNRLPDALNLHEKLAISDATLRDAAGYGEDTAPDEEELLRRIGSRGAVDPSLTYALLSMIAAAAGIVIPTPSPGTSSGGPTRKPIDGEEDEDEQPALPSGETQRPDAVAASADGGGNDIPADVTPAAWTDRALALDLDLRSRVEAAADAAMRRALERAGARVVARVQRSADLKATIAGVPSIAVPAAVGRDRLLTLGIDPDTLLDGAFDDLAVTFRTWAGATFEQGLQAACDVLGLTYYPPGVDGLTAAVDPPPFSDADTAPLRGLDQVAMRNRWAADVASAADGLVEDLVRQARERLFSPVFEAPEFGEHDPALAVPPGTVRKALARAGGAGSSPSFSDVDDRGVPANPSDGDAGLVATGRTLVEGLTVAGVPVYAYRWVWGGSPRPFAPHKELDGRTFADQRDGALAVPDTYAAWLPATSYFPGDHAGCRCSTARLVSDPFADMDPADARRVRAAQKARDARGRFVASAT